MIQELTFDVYPVEFRRKGATKKPENAVEFARRRLEFEPDELKVQVLLSDSKRGILNCSRQWGKSTVAAAKAVHPGAGAAGGVWCWWRVLRGGRTGCFCGDGGGDAAEAENSAEE